MVFAVLGFRLLILYLLGSFKLIYPNGREDCFGEVEQGKNPLQVRIEDVDLFYNLIKDSDIALGEAYMENKMVVSNGSEGMLKISKCFSNGFFY